MGVSKYLTKPISSSELIEEINQLTVNDVTYPVTKLTKDVIDSREY